ncbi:melanoma antigen recognized by T-cells 1 [Brachionichthys hirsutus]|uniref:melanoma antigen recognized by T-cells 1 n=1 Tax=Brachionichthys hirsutus TaxID=412623 RepID=UPI0036052F07
MPRGGFNIYFARSSRGYVRAEEAVGIVVLVAIVAALLILGCWYFKKRSGYKIIRVGPSYLCIFLHFLSIGCIFFPPLLQVPNAPPTYEKMSSGPLPPPYSP